MAETNQWVETTAQYVKDNQKAVVIMPTGYGKTVGAAQIAPLVTNRGDKILYVAPSRQDCANFLKMLPKDSAMNCEATTYSYLHKHRKRYLTQTQKLLIVDEAHRAGARKWSSIITPMIDTNSQYVVALTATPIRSQGKERDVRRRFFKGIVPHEVTFAQAIYENILDKPTLVRAGLFFSEKMKERIKKLRQKPFDKMSRREIALIGAVKRAERIRRDLEGLPGLIRRRISPDRKKWIVFCPNVKSIPLYERYVQMACKKSNRAVISKVITGRTKASLRDQIEREAKEYSGHATYILYAVNVLGESFHHPEFNTVLVFRNTSSPIKYMQMAGRSIVPKKYSLKPGLIIDIVDNSSRMRYRKAKTEATEKEAQPETCSEDSMNEKSEDEVAKRIPESWFSSTKVIDENYHICAVTNALRIDTGEWDANMGLLMQWYAENKKRPPIGNWLRGFLKEALFLEREGLLMDRQREAFDKLGLIKRQEIVSTNKRENIGSIEHSIERFIALQNQPTCVSCKGKHFARTSAINWVCTSCGSSQDIFRRSILRKPGVTMDLLCRAATLFTDPTYEKAGIDINYLHIHRAFAVPTDLAQRISTFCKDYATKEARTHENY